MSMMKAEYLVSWLQVVGPFMKPELTFVGLILGLIVFKFTSISVISMRQTVKVADKKGPTPSVTREGFGFSENDKE